MDSMTQKQKEEQQRLIQFKKDEKTLYSKGAARFDDEILKNAAVDRSVGIIDQTQPLLLKDIAYEVSKRRQAEETEDGELFEKSMPVFEEMIGFETLETEQMTHQELVNKAMDARREKAEAYDIPQTLYKSSDMQKARILKNLKLSEIDRDDIIREHKSLEEIIHSYVDEKEKIEAAKEGKRFLKIFRNAKEELNGNPFLTGRERIERLYRLAKPFETSIVMYKEEYFVTLDKTSREEGIEKLLDRITRFYDLFSDGDELHIGEELSKEQEQILIEMQININIGEDESVTERIAQNARNLDKSTARSSDPALDRSLTRDQINGIRSIDRFLIEQGADSGDNLPFLDKLLSLTMRDRLMIYGLIEKNREYAPDPTDIAMTQISYMPDLASFRNRMSFLPKIMWGGDKRSTVSRHITFLRWEKIESAIDILKQPAAVEVRDTFAKLYEDHEDEVKDVNENRTVQNRTGEEEAAPDENADEETKLVMQLEALEAQRDEGLKDVIKALNECKDALDDVENTTFKKKEKKAIAEQKSKAVKDALERLNNTDKILANTIKSVYIQAGLEPENEERQIGKIADASHKQVKGKKEPESTGKKALNGGIFVSSQGSLLLSKLDKMITLSQGDATLLQNFTSGAFATVTGVLGLMGAIMGFIRIKDSIKANHKSLGTTDIINTVTQSAKSLGGTGWGALAGTYSMGLAIAGKVAAKKAAKGAMDAANTIKDNVTIATNAATYANVVVSTMKFGADMVDAAVSVKRIAHHGYAAYRINKLEKSGELKGVDKVYADNILKIDERIKIRQSINIIDNMLVDASGAIATLFGGPIGAVAYAGAAIVNAFVMKGYNMISKKIERGKMIDDFLQVEAVAKACVKDYDKMGMFAKRSARKKVRQQMAAELGYVSDKALSAHIIGNYAAYIYDKLFYNDDEQKTPLLKKHDEEKKLSKMSLACYQMVKSLGLDVTYPESDDGQRYPTIAMIAAKLSV